MRPVVATNGPPAARSTPRSGGNSYRFGNIGITINPLTLTSGSGSVTGQLTATVAAVPEPATWAMMIGGFGLVGGALRTRRKASVAYA